MRGIRSVLGALVGFGALNIQVYSSESELLHAKLVRYLDRVENGRSPCFTSECQGQKAHLLMQLFQETSQLPYVDEVLLKSRKTGIDSAFRLVAKPFIPATNTVPFRMSDWMDHWKRRFTYETQIQSSWLAFQSDLYHLQDGLQMYQRLIRKPREKLHLIEELEDKGAFQACSLMIESAKLIELSRVYETQGRKLESQKARERALQLHAQREAIESKFQGHFREVLEAVFTGSSFQEIVSFLDASQKWRRILRSSSLFEPQFQSRMNGALQKLKRITQIAQDFNDLEYGVVGLKNFYSSTNPAIRAESEILIQEALDQVEQKLRLLIDLAATYFLIKTGPQIFNSPWIAQTALPTLYQWISIQKGVDLSSEILPPSQRTQSLAQRLPQLQEQMEARYQELWKTRDALKERILELKLEMTQDQQREE